MSERPPAYERIAELTYHFEQADTAWEDWKRGDVDITAVTSELYAVARAAFATATRLREDDATVAAEGDLFDQPEFVEAFGARVVDPFAGARAAIRDLPTAEGGEQR